MNAILVLTYARTIANIFLKIYELLIFLRDFVISSRYLEIREKQTR